MTTYAAGEFDIAVIGAGHAGIEAALAGTRMGLRRAGCADSRAAPLSGYPQSPHIYESARAGASGHGRPHAERL